MFPIVGEDLSETFEMNPEESSKWPRRILHTCPLYIKIIFCSMFYIVYSKESQTLGHRPVPVCDLLGTRLRSRRAGSKLSFFCIYSHSPSLTVPPPVRSVVTLDSHRSPNSTIAHHLQMRLFSYRKTGSGLPLILHHGELYNGFIIYHNVIIIEIKCTIK